MSYAFASNYRVRKKMNSPIKFTLSCLLLYSYSTSHYTRVWLKSRGQQIKSWFRKNETVWSTANLYSG